MINLFDDFMRDWMANNEVKTRSVGRLVPAITEETMPDGVIELVRCGQVIGRISPILFTRSLPTGYRALNAHNEIRHFDGLAAAKDWLHSSYA